MTRRRWIADEFSADKAALTGAHATHLARVLRAQVGQEFEVACGDQVRRATVTSVTENRVEFALGEAVAPGDVVPITLLLAVFKFDRMEWAIEKCTELNVTKIVPVIAQRTEKHLAQAAGKRVERWRRIAREAAEQSRRMAPPEIAEPVKLAEALGCDAEARVVLAEGERERALLEVLRPRLAQKEGEGEPFDKRRADSEASRPVQTQVSPKAGRTWGSITSLALAVGPEGGWTEAELKRFEEAGWAAASLGQTILRAETAAIAAVAITQQLATSS